MTGPTQQHQHVETIDQAVHTYAIHVGGTMDGANTRDPVGYTPYAQAWENNISVCLENVGAALVRNPWVVVNGRRLWRSLQEILAEVLTADDPPALRARRLWEFARRHRYHYTTGDDEVKDTVKMLNVYGYTLCWDEAYTLANLWQAAGLKIRRGVPHGHCTTEVFYDGAYHLLDSDEHLLYLRRDNRTVASEEDLARDHDLVRRGHAYGILAEQDPATEARTAALFGYSGPRAGGRPLLARHRMDLELRPGEALLWEWADRGKYHGYGARPPRLANGRLRFRPPLDASAGTWAEQMANLISTGAMLVPALPSEESWLQYRIAAPYVCVGGRVSGVAGWRVELSFDGASWAPVRDGDLDAHFPPAGPPRYAYHLRLSGRSVALQELAIETDLQMAPLSLPALEVGTNEIRYLDAGEGPRSVRVTHVWQERGDVEPPARPTAARQPVPGAVADAAQVEFAWEPVAGAVDYEFRLGERADLGLALSPVFERLMSRTPGRGAARWRVPGPGLLNPGQVYFWRVRGRNAAGLWGPLGPAWRFTAAGPGVPLEPHLAVDYEHRTMTLCWRPNPAGEPPHHYEVYGSDERGFTAHRSAYQRQEGPARPASTQPANLLAETEGTALLVVGPQVPDGRGNRAFYRVVAVDGHGRRSGPSDYAAAPLPFVFSRPPARAVAGQQAVWVCRSLRAEGDLRCLSDGPHRYQAAFRDQDVLSFILDEGPEFLALDARSGRLVVEPPHDRLGFHTVTIRVQRLQGGKDAVGFDLEVIAEGCT